MNKELIVYRLPLRSGIGARSHSETHVCYEGLVYVGYMTEEDGEEVERVDVPQLWYLEG